MPRRFFPFLTNVQRLRSLLPVWVPGGIVFARKETALVSHLSDGSFVVYNIIDRMAYLLNETAGTVLELTDGRRSVRIVAEKLCEMYDINERSGRRRVVVDVKRIYRRLYQCGIFSRESRILSYRGIALSGKHRFSI